MPDQPEHEPAGQGHNGPSHDDIRIAAHEMVKLNAERATLNAKVSQFRKGQKAKGITLGVLDAMVKMLEWSPEEIKAHFAERDWYAEALRYPIGAQMEFFGTDATPDAVKEQLKWKQIGVKDGIAGRGWANEPPQGCPPDCVQVYGEGHEEGQRITLNAYAQAKKVPVPVAVPEPEPAAISDLDPEEQEEAIAKAARRLKKAGFMDKGDEALEQLREVA